MDFGAENAGDPSAIALEESEKKLWKQSASRKGVVSPKPPFSIMERAPWYVIYAFHLPCCAWLALRYGGFALPTISNPGLDVSGLTNESKRELFGLLGPTGSDHLPPFVTVTIGANSPFEAQQLMQARGICFPVVIKPDIGRRGFGVKLVRNPAELESHLGKFDRGVTLLIQRYAEGPGEAGLFYARMPSESNGRIVSLTIKHFPEVVGDGISTIRELILRDPRARVFAKLYFKRNHKFLQRVLAPGERHRIVTLGNHVRGSAFTDASEHITPSLQAVIDKIAREIPGFFVGRFDVRYSSLEALKRGESFEIVEYNGASGEPTHMWDPATSIWATYRGLFEHLHYLYAIGAENFARGAKPVSALEIVRRHFAELQLLRRYPDEE